MVRTTAGSSFPTAGLSFTEARADQVLHKLIRKVLIKDAPKMLWVL